MPHVRQKGAHIFHHVLLSVSCFRIWNWPISFLYMSLRPENVFYAVMNCEYLPGSTTQTYQLRMNLSIFKY